MSQVLRAERDKGPEGGALQNSCGGQVVQSHPLPWARPKASGHPDRLVTAMEFDLAAGTLPGSGGFAV